MAEEHRHAAILFTDIVGYTRLMGTDEDKAVDTLSRNRSIHQSCIEKFNGTLIKEIGDGILASFSLASQAVRCAIEIQKECKEQGIPLKIGIHEGEMIFSGSDVIGDGVNIASRLQEDAQEGCINISASVYSNIRNKADIKTALIGEKSYKNVGELTRVYSVLLNDNEFVDPSSVNFLKIQKTRQKLNYYLLIGVTAAIIIIILVWRYIPEKNNVEKEKSIAILPFKNLSSNPDDQYLADGMMDAILNHLYRIEALSVRSRTSTVQYRDPNRNLTEIGKALNANYILEGSFQKIGAKANLIVQLIFTETDEHIWVEEYNRDWSDVFTIQKEIAERIAKELYANISSDAKRGIEHIPTSNMEAYDFYLKGDEAHWNFWQDYDVEKVYASLKYFRKSVELDNRFSLGYAGLGRSYWMLAQNAPNSTDEMFENSKKYLTKAIELDPYNGWAYAELSVVLDLYNRDSTAARTNLDIALRLIPNEYNAYVHYFHHEQRLGNCEKMKWIREGMLSVNPKIGDDSIDHFKIAILICKNDWGKIVELVDKYWTEDSTVRNRMSFCRAYMDSHQYEKARQMVESLRQHSKKRSIYYVTNGGLHARLGDTVVVNTMLDSLQFVEKTEYVPDFHYALLYALIGDSTQMYLHLERAVENGEVYSLKGIPAFEAYYSEPKFQEIIRTIWIPRHKN